MSNHARKIHEGRYEYKGIILQKYNFYDTVLVWWEGVDKEGNAEYHAHTKKELMKLIDDDKK